MKMKCSFRFIVAIGMALFSPQSCDGFDVNVVPGMASRAWGVYKELLRTDALITKSLTSSGIMTISDALCQKLVIMKNSPKPSYDSKDPVLENTSSAAVAAAPTRLDFSRMLQVAITGVVWSGPIQHWWFGTLDKMVTIQNPILRLIVKLFFDSIIFSPLTIAGYFAVRSILEGSGFRGAYDKLSTRLVSTVKGAWRFWPFVNILNFSLVPLQFRVLYSNILSLFWTGYLTFVNSKPIPRVSEDSASTS